MLVPVTTCAYPKFAHLLLPLTGDIGRCKPMGRENILDAQLSGDIPTSCSIAYDMGKACELLRHPSHILP